MYQISQVEQKTSLYAYRAALYARISVETAEKIERDTIGTQVALLQEFAGGIADLVVEDTYIDDDISGANFNRPEYERLMRDVDCGRINCIIVKDLSRFARNHISAGEYLEKIFPEKGVRFISITDNIDTLEGDGGIIVPFKNVLNERYSKEASMKLTANFKTMQRSGQFCSSKAPYGYIRSEDDKHLFDVDDEAAKVVRQIFEWFVSGKTQHWIVRELTKREIPCPSQYAMEKGFFKEKHGVSKTPNWNKEQIAKILNMRQYCGDMVQNKTESIFLQTGVKGKCRANDKADWIIVEDTHEPLVTREMFMKVQEMLAENARKHKEKLEMNKHIKNPEYCLRGVMVCGHCGARMAVKRRVKDGIASYSYICPKHDSFGNARCVKKAMSFDETNHVVFLIIKRYMNNFLDIEKALKDMKKCSSNTNKSEELWMQLNKMESELLKAKKIKMGLYEDMVQGLIDESDYLYMTKKYTDDEARLYTEVEELKDRIAIVDSDRKIADEVEVTIRKFIKSRKLSIAMVEAYIERITVDNDGRFDVELKMKDEFEELASQLSRLKGELQSA